MTTTAQPPAHVVDGPSQALDAGYQPSMWDVEATAELTGLAGRVQRTWLSDGAWIDRCPGWLQGSDQLLDTLLRTVAWRAERRPMYDRVVDVPRLLAWFGPEATWPDPLLVRAKAALDAQYEAELGERFHTIGLCLYRDGRDSVAWHGDTVGRGSRIDTMVAILSVGSDRPLLLRPRRGGSGLRLPLGHGDLVVMGGSCQRTWEHAIPKTARAVGPRISIQFRPVGVS